MAKIKPVKPGGEGAAKKSKTAVKGQSRKTRGWSNHNESRQTRGWGSNHNESRQTRGGGLNRNESRQTRGRA